MEYWRVKDNCKNVLRVTIDENNRVYTKGYYIPGELYTENEINEFLGGKRVCELVDIDMSTMVYWRGMRFTEEDYKKAKMRDETGGWNYDRP